MTDNITLRRAAEQARSALSGWANHGLWAWPESALQTCKQNTEEALVALDAALAEPEPESKTPAWWMDGLTATLMREGVNKHRAREIAIGYWEAYCQIPGNEEDMK
jgi:hypothetical protein